MAGRLVTLIIWLIGLVGAGDTVLAAPKALQLDAPPIVYEGAVLAPVRPIAEWLGAQVSFNSSTQTISAATSMHRIAMRLGDRSAMVDGVTRTMSIPAINLQGITLAPLRFLVENLGYQVQWDIKTRQALITAGTRQAVFTVPPTSDSKTAAVTVALGAWNTTGLAPSAGAAVHGGIYRVGVFEEPKTNNIIAALGVAGTVWTYAPLLPQYSALYGNYAPRFDWAPAMAANDPSSLKQEGAYYTSTVQLRNDLVWSDGTPFSAADVVFTYMSILKIGPDKLSGNWETIVNKNVLERVEAVGDHIIKFYLKTRPGLSEWQYGLLQASILSKKHWEPVFAKAFLAKDPVQFVYGFDDVNPVTIGGYVGGRWERGAFFEIKKDPKSIFPSESISFHQAGFEVNNKKSGFHYQSEDMSGPVVGVVQSGPMVDSTIYRLFLGQNAAYLALQKGEIDYVLNSSGLQKGTRDLLDDHPDIQLVQNPQNGFRYLGFNCDRYPMNTVAFRQAIATVIDSEWLAQTILQGVVEPVASVVPPGNGFWHNPNVKVWGKGLNEYERVREAVRILKSAGFTWTKEPQVVPARGGFAVEEGEGLKGPDGKAVPRLTLLTPTTGYDPLRFVYAQWVQTWVSALGIDLRAKPTDFNLISTKQNQRDYDMVIAGWTLGIYPNHIKAFFHSESSMNRVSYRNPAFDAVADAFASADSMDAARKYAFQAQAILAEDVPYVVLFSTPIVEAYRKDKIRYEFTQVLDGIQGLFSMPSSVQVLD